MVALENWLAGLDPLAHHGAAALLAVAGVALWLLGRSLARPLGAFAGLLAGAGAAALIPVEGYGPIAVIVGSFVGCVAAWLLFRIWVGAMAAALAATLVFAGFMIWPDLPGAIETPTATEIVAATNAPGAGDVFDAMLETFRQRWAEVKASRGPMVLGATAGAALAGLLTGLIAPYCGASILCAALGTLMVTCSLASWGRLAGWPRPEVLEEPTHLIAALGLITGIGVALQWIIFRSRSD